MTTIPHVDIATELHREAASRRRAYPGMIERLRLTQAQADVEQLLVATWLQDLERYAAYAALPDPRPAPPLMERVNGFTWADRRAGVQRELDRRSRLYPKWIAAGDLDAAEAATRTARLTALLDFYDEGWDWHDSFGRRFDLRPIDPTPDQAETNRQWLAHIHNTLSRRHGTPQQEALAL